MSAFDRAPYMQKYVYRECAYIHMHAVCDAFCFAPRVLHTFIKNTLVKTRQNVSPEQCKR